MHLLRLTCQGFRCLEEVDFQPEPAINIVWGGNAQGKTSLLEAVLFAATSKSHRTNLETDLVMHEAKGFRIQATGRRHDRDVTLEVAWWQGVKRIKVNGVAQSRVSDILGKIHVVLFSPEDVTLVRGSAAHRRRFLDMALSQLDARYLDSLQRYRQALRQRNEVLRTSKPDPALLEVWEAQLDQYAGRLIRDRAACVERLARDAAAAYARIAPDEVLDVAYQPDVPADESLLAILTKNRDRDRRRGLTSRGPHRDDLMFMVDGQAARNYASQGQQKTVALALKLAEVELVKDRTGEYPILLLDEVLAELDAPRAQRLAEAIDDGVQCLLTTTHRDRHDALLGAPWPCYRMKRGRIEKE